VAAIGFGFNLQVESLWIAVISTKKAECFPSARRVTAKGSRRYRDCARCQQRRLLCDQTQCDSVASAHNSFYPAHNIFYRLCVRSRNDFERTIAYRAVPKMTDLPLISILGPLGGNQLNVALNAICTEARTTFGCYHSHDDSAAVGSK
jgi:hypothetical protein